jgi:hypothetical protein
VGGDEVVVPVPTSGAYFLGSLRGKLCHALDSADVSLLFGRGERGP